ncbi:MAG TPA: hypothetical protein VGL80_28530 [Pseudonocardiaceae bacterium]
MNTFLGIAVDATASIDSDCDMTHAVSPNCVEIDFGHSTGSLHLGMTEAAVAKLVNVATVALDELRELRVGPAA